LVAIRRVIAFEDRKVKLKSSGVEIKG
jgi:hypothetical protein